MTTPNAALADADLLYLVRLADWAAGQGFCQIDGIEDPEEWCFRKWSELGPPNGDGYSAEALATALRQPSSVSDEVVERAKEGLQAAIRAAELALFVIRKQGVMPNSSWESGFNSDLNTARKSLAALPLDEVSDETSRS
jgi:hypothetical protein